MPSIFTLWALIGIITALVVPNPNPNPKPILDSLHTRQTDPVPPFDTWTSHTLNNTVILPPEPCLHLTSLGTSNLAQTQTLNATQCYDLCAETTTMYFTYNPSVRCRFFNAYMLFKNGENLGMKCNFFKRWYGDEWATNNGSLDPWGKVRNDLYDGTAGDEWEVRDSVVFWRKGEEGDLSCPAAKLNPVVSTGVTSASASANISSEQTSSTSISASFSTLVPPKNTSTSDAAASVVPSGTATLVASATPSSGKATSTAGRIVFVRPPPFHKVSSTFKTSATKSTTKLAPSSTAVSKSSNWRRNGNTRWGSSGSMRAMHGGEELL